MFKRMLRFLHRLNSPATIIEEPRRIAPKDYALHSGERQTARTLDEIRKDHVVRYELAAELIKSVGNGTILNCLDVFCGNGYGSYLLAKSCPRLRIIGIDGSREAIDVANEHYSLENSLFAHKTFPFRLPIDAFEFVTCFESLEHVEDDHALLSQMFAALKVQGVLMVSVPNQDRHALERNPHHFHFRHYRHEDFLKLLPFNFNLVRWYGQDVYEFSQDGVNTFKLLPTGQMALRQETQGQVNIYIVRKIV